MEGIYETNAEFPFHDLTLASPMAMAGGNYFIKFIVNDNPLYIQPPKCKTKNGLSKAGKRFYTDLMFSNENESFLRWMEDLENFACNSIFENREKWFETTMEKHDIENYFTSPLKVYKSGKFYLVRTYAPTRLGKMTLKIYNENEEDVDPETINDNTSVITILEVQGIKCSARSFQIEMELKQMMVLKPNNLFEKCIIKKASGGKLSTITNEPVSMRHEDSIHLEKTNNAKEEEEEGGEDNEYENESGLEPIVISDTSVPLELNELNSKGDEAFLEIDDLSAMEEYSNITEVNLDLDKVANEDTMKIKSRNDVYHEMYRKAKEKARAAREFALSAYLEAKRIRNTYMIKDALDYSDDSDLDENSLNFENVIAEQ